MKKKIVIESDENSVYGTISYEDYDYRFQLLYSNGDNQTLKFERETPNQKEWQEMLTKMLITDQLI